MVPYTKKGTILITKMLGKLNYSLLRVLKIAFNILPSQTNLIGMKL